MKVMNYDRAAAEATFGVSDWRRFLRSLGEDPGRSGLIETPERVAQAWCQWSAGYAQDPNEILKVFEDGAEGYGEMVVVAGIPVYSHCEHHLAPFFGTAAVGYIPNGRIVGLSKFTRLVNCFARRLQVQERLTNQIANTILENLKPEAVGVTLKCRHLCMESRGISCSGQMTTTLALMGRFQQEPNLRAEFFRQVDSHS